MNRKTPLARVVLLTLACSICLLTTGGAAAAEAQRPKLDKADLKKARKQAAGRQRRIVYNDDGCHGEPQNTPEQVLAHRVRQVTDTQVDTICYCTGGGGLFWRINPRSAKSSASSSGRTRNSTSGKCATGWWP